MRTDFKVEQKNFSKVSDWEKYVFFSNRKIVTRKKYFVAITFFDMKNCEIISEKKKNDLNTFFEKEKDIIYFSKESFKKKIKLQFLVKEFFFFHYCD